MILIEIMLVLLLGFSGGMLYSYVFRSGIMTLIEMMLVLLWSCLADNIILLLSLRGVL